MCRCACMWGCGCVCVAGLSLQPGREGGEPCGPFGDPEQKTCLVSCGQVSLRHQDSEKDKAGVRNTPGVAHKGTSRPWESGATQEDHLDTQWHLRGKKKHCMRSLAPVWPMRNVLSPLLQLDAFPS